MCDEYPSIPPEINTANPNKNTRVPFTKSGFTPEGIQEVVSVLDFLAWSGPDTFEAGI